MERVFAAFDIGTQASPSFRTFSNFGDLVSVIVKNAYVLAGVLSFLLLVFGAFGFIMGAGGGDSKKMEEAKQTLTWAVVGLLLVIGSYWIILILSKITGYNILSPPAS
ncbi:hypothetical protein M1555_04180 [Patescibacteria group bacterium]|nr:hypothetical protein [Patescibacteria group bacterium]